MLCQVRGPSPTDPNIIMDDLLTPCSPGMRRASCFTRVTCAKVNLLNRPSYHSDVFSRGMFESSNGFNAAVCRRSIEEDSLAFHRLYFSSKTVWSAYEYLKIAGFINH